MKAVNLTGKPSGGERLILKENIPLDTPLSICIFPIYACNFKCAYCSFSVDEKERGLSYQPTRMNFSTYCKCIDDMTQFPRKIKKLRFAGLGEPLLHSEIAEMVQYASEKKVAESIEIVSNGSMLTPELSDKLIAANLSKLYISIQGINAEAYQEICKVKLNFNEFVDNIKYFYEHRKNTHLFLKTVDFSLHTEDEFYEIFGDICDSISIEKIAPLSSKVNYSNLVSEERRSVRGHEVDADPICAFPFYMMQINPDGSVIPCCTGEQFPSMGNCATESIKDIWMGQQINQFRVQMLEGGNKNMEDKYFCKKCKFNYVLFSEDKITLEDGEKLKHCFKI